MGLVAIKVLGTLHALVAVLSMRFAFGAFALAPTEQLSRARITYVGTKALFTSVMLILCAITAWWRPSSAWVFAVASLLGYAPAPSWAQASPAATKTLTKFGQRFRLVLPFAICCRMLGALLMALAAYGVHG